jgi:serine protease Do
MKMTRTFLGACLAALCFAALAQTRELPDFTRLVEEQGNAVVNISTTQVARRSAQLPGQPGI